MTLNKPIANGRMSYARRRGGCFPARGDRVEYWPVAIAKTIECQAGLTTHRRRRRVSGCIPIGGT